MHSCVKRDLKQLCHQVAAGGGSILFFRSGIFAVGPDSAGSHPGPACYRKGGPLTITDANVLLGRVRPEYFPHIFGPNETEPLDVDATRAAFEVLTAEINAFLDKVRWVIAHQHLCDVPVRMAVCA